MYGGWWLKILFLGPRSVEDPRFSSLANQLMTAYVVDKVKNIDEIINTNTALKQINELKQIEEDKQNRKRAYIHYARSALKTEDYLITWAQYFVFF